MFIDSVKVFLQSGSGGNGCLAYYYRGLKRYPAGGNGGKGGDIYLQGSTELDNLNYLKNHPHQKAEKGAAGQGENKNGRQGREKIIKVPLGTVVLDEAKENIICEIINESEKVMLLEGSKGGIGNQNSKLKSFNFDNEKLKGSLGVEKTFIFDFKVLTDLAIVGLTNVGKSAFVSKISKQKSKIADYTFTTLTPQLAMVNLPDYRSLRIIDLPGLIDGSHLGKGLGNSFLKHLQRAKFLLFIIDVSKDSQLTISESFTILKKELSLFAKELLKKPIIAILNKQDKLDDLQKLEKEKEYLKKNKIKVYLISSKTGYGINDFINGMQNIIN